MSHVLSQVGGGGVCETEAAAGEGLRGRQDQETRGGRGHLGGLQQQARQGEEEPRGAPVRGQLLARRGGREGQAAG